MLKKNGDYTPNFGTGRVKREAEWARECEKTSGKASIGIAERHLQRRLQRPVPPSKIPSVSNIIGRALEKVGSYGQLNNKEHVSCHGNNNSSLNEEGSKAPINEILVTPYVIFWNNQ